MTTPEVRLVPALAEHLEVWMEMRADPEARRLMPLEEDTPQAGGGEASARGPWS